MSPFCAAAVAPSVQVCVRYPMHSCVHVTWVCALCMYLIQVFMTAAKAVYVQLTGMSLPCDAMHSAAIAGMRCPSVCLSVTFMSCAKTNKDIFEIFSPCGSQTILVFPYQTGWRYSNGNHPNGGVECKGGMKKLKIFDQYLAVSQKRL